MAKTDHLKNSVATAKSKQICILVLTMHRSGSSALTWALSRMGAGLPKHILGANSTNQYGHWEPELLLRQHDKFLGGVHSAWDDWRPFKISKYSKDKLRQHADAIWKLIDSEYDLNCPFVLKDPRVCRFADFYLDLLSTKNVVPKVVIGLRNPLEVMASLKSRNGLSEGTGALLWLRHMLDAEFASRNVDRVIVDYNEYLNNPEETIQTMADELGVFEDIAVDLAKKASSEFVHPSQRHHNSKAEDLDLHPLTSAWVKDTYKALLTLQGAPNSQQALSVLDDVRTMLDGASPIIDRIGQDLRKESEFELAEAKKTLSAVVEQEFNETGGGLRVQALEQELEIAAKRLLLEKQLYDEFQSRQSTSISDLQARIETLNDERQKLTVSLLHEQDRNKGNASSLSRQNEIIKELKVQNEKLLEEHQRLSIKLLREQDRNKENASSLSRENEIIKELKVQNEKLLEEQQRLSIKLLREQDRNKEYDGFASLIEVNENQKYQLSKLYVQLNEEEARNNADIDALKSKIEALKRRNELADKEIKGLKKTIALQKDSDEAKQLKSALNKSKRKLLESEQQIRQVRKQYRASERRNQAYYNSFSWKVTRPIRGVKRSLTEKGFIGEAWAHMFPALAPRPKGSSTEKKTKPPVQKENEPKGVAIPVKPSSSDKLAKDPYNCSTYNVGRPYPFPSQSRLNEIGAAYLEAKKERKEQVKVAVFMAITGGYDGLKYHEHLSPEIDYFIFGENEFDAPYVYEFKRIEHYDEDSTRIARFVKTHAHTLLADYDVAIWVDGNIIIREDISSIIERFTKSDNVLAAVPHPIRTDVYKEASECISRGKDDNQAIENQMKRYQHEGFQTDALIESNFIMFKPKDRRTKGLLNMWWSEIETGSRRDQLSLNYSLFKNGLDYDRITERPNSVRNHPKLALLQHGAEATARPSVKVFDSGQDLASSYSDIRDERIAMHRHRKIDVIVCVHNALDVVIPCLESVRATRNEVKHQIIIVDDGSSDETREYLSKFALDNNNVRLVRHESASGYTRAANAGLRASSGEFMVLLNSDTVVSPNWLEKMADAVFSRPGCGIVGPMSNAASSQSVPEHRSSKTQTVINTLPQGLTPELMDQWCEENSDPNFLPRTSLVHGFCFGITRETIEIMGLFDEDSFPSGYGEENDYCLRAVAKGLSLVIATHTYVFHVKSSSYTPEARVPLMKAGNTKLRDIHGNERVARAIRSLQNNPHLARMRDLAGDFYKAKGYKN